MRTLPRAMTIAVLFLWVLAGPVGMAFDGCAAMGGMCEGPCAPTTVSLIPLVQGLPLPLLAMVTVAAPARAPAIALTVPDLPPKSLQISL